MFCIQRLFYSKLPKDVAEKQVLLCDPMLGTGGSVCLYIYIYMYLCVCVMRSQMNNVYIYIYRLSQR